VDVEMLGAGRILQIEDSVFIRGRRRKERTSRKLIRLRRGLRNILAVAVSDRLRQQAVVNVYGGSIPSTCSVF
jgi:hypothetical protein